jgi:SHS2 domain-containing protein
MTYTFLEHEADIGIEATGSTIEEALEVGVQGMLDLMVDTEAVEPTDATPVTAEGSDPGGLFVALLNAVLAERDIAGHFFRSFRIDRLEQSDDHWRVEGVLWGEPVDLKRHSVGNEVKAATYSGLRFTDEPDSKTLRCILDI